MLFNSIPFFIFLPVVFLLHWFVFNKSVKSQNISLLIASYFFYGWWSWSFLGLLFLSTLLDYLYGFGVASENKRKSKLFLWLSVINNLGILAVFKYFNFFSTELSHALSLVGIAADPILLDIILPVGISFYTFHGMSYVFDIYRKLRKPVTSLLEYSLFVSFFPLLVAGPIERSGHLLPQLQKIRVFSYQQSVEGCRLILWGLFKKVVFADNLASLVDVSFEHYMDQTGGTLIIAAIAFAFQIYADFSGYSDIAIGTCKLFGIELLSNFKYPFFSRDVGEFWRRWHISLSTWLRDYLFVPLGGLKAGRLKRIRNTFIVFLACGFWHGASWNFLAFGFVQGCGFVPGILSTKKRVVNRKVVAFGSRFPDTLELFQMIRTFSFLLISFIFFRAQTFKDAMGIFKKIFSDLIFHPIRLVNFSSLCWTAVVIIVPFILIDWWQRYDERKLKPWHPVWSIVAVLAIWFFLRRDSTFIYFKF